MQPASLGARRLCLVSTSLIAALVALPCSAQTVETSQQINDRIRALSATSRATPPRDYVIGSGDLISIQVFDVPELSREIRVSQTGSIGLPLVPVRLHVTGLTELQAGQKIAEVLEANGLVTHPDVTVTVKDRKSKPITIVGAVIHPMVYQADRQVTLLDALAEAGGITPDAGASVIITRLESDLHEDPSAPPVISPQDAESSPIPAAQPEQALTNTPPPAAASPAVTGPEAIPPPISNTITVNLNQILETGDTSNNIVLVPGDVVTVPHAGIVYALGAVNRPGGFAVSNDRGQLTTLKLLALAGGLINTAKSGQAVIVRKDASTGQQHQVPVDLKKVMNFQAEDLHLLPSDILYVPKSATKQALFKTAELAAAIGSAIIIYRLIQ